MGGINSEMESFLLQCTSLAMFEALASYEDIVIMLWISHRLRRLKLWPFDVMRVLDVRQFMMKMFEARELT
jgi:hypothetical protein